MRFRGRIKQALYGHPLFYRGYFPYFGQKIFFPRGSVLFSIVCADGVYEKGVISVINAFVRPGTTYIDVGANIGLLSIPILTANPETKVVAIEASPKTVEYLERTHSASGCGDRWTIIGAAVGAENGHVTFHVSGSENSAYDGLRDTKRGGAKTGVSVPCFTLDQVWTDLGRPAVSVIKMDTEGGETAVVAGARALIDKERPALVIEWNAENLAAYDLPRHTLFDVCDSIGYDAFSFPDIVQINSPNVLTLAMMTSENFVLLPRERKPDA